LTGLDTEVNSNPGVYKFENTPTPGRKNISQCHQGGKCEKGEVKKVENMNEKGETTKTERY
jgi:hypothetical protein